MFSSFILLSTPFGSLLSICLQFVILYPVVYCVVVYLPPLKGKVWEMLLLPSVSPALNKGLHKIDAQFLVVKWGNVDRNPFLCQALVWEMSYHMRSEIEEQKHRWRSQRFLACAQPYSSSVIPGLLLNLEATQQHVGASLTVGTVIVP